jgi:MFS family permease
MTNKFPSTERNNFARLAVLYFFILQGLVIGIYSSNVSIFSDELNLSDFVLGVVTSFLSLGYIIAAPISAGLGRIYGTKDVTLVASQLFGISLGVIGICGNVKGSNAFFLATGCFIFGLTLGLMDIADNSQGILVEIVQNKSELGFFHGSYAGAVALGTLIGGGLLYSMGDESSMFICIVSGIVLCSFAYPCTGPYLYDQELEMCIEQHKRVKESLSPSTIERSRDAEPLILSHDHILNSNCGAKHSTSDTSLEPLIQCLWPRGLLRVYCIVGFLGSVAEGGLIVWTPKFFEDYLGADTLTKQFGLAAYMLGEALTRWFLVDKLRQQLGRRWLVILGGLLGALSCVGGVYASCSSHNTRVPIATVCFFFFGIGTAPLIPVAYSSGGHSVDNTQAAISTVGFCTDFGSVVGPFIVGVSSSLLGGLRPALLVAACIISLSVPFGFGFPSETEQYQRDKICNENEDASDTRQLLLPKSSP